MAVDPDKELEDMMRAHVYLGRYMRMSVREVERMEVWRVREYLRLLSEAIQKESPDPRGPGEAG